MADRRLIYLDALRGFFIIYVMFMHSMIGVVFRNDPAALEKTPVWLFIVLLPVAVLSTWAPIFVVISGTAHAYVLHGVMVRHQNDHAVGAPFRPFLVGSFMTGLLLYALSLFNMGFVHHSMPYNGAVRHTLFTGALHEGHWLPFDVNLLFYNDALSMVAVNALLTNTVLYLLWRKKGFQHPRRYTTSLIILAAGILLVSPVVHAGLDPFFFDALNSGNLGMAMVLKLVVGPNFSPLPYLSYGLIGAVIGVALAKGVAVSKIRRYGYGVSILLLACGGVLMLLQGFKVTDLAQHPFPLRIHLLNVGAMLFCCTWLILHMEYCTKERRARVARRTVWLRRLGLMALTIFCLESFFGVLLSRAYLWVLGIDGAFPQTALYIVPFVILVFAFWNAVFLLWEKADFKYSVEWWMSWLVCKARKRPSRRLQAEEVLRRPCIPATALAVEAPVKGI